MLGTKYCGKGNRSIAGEFGFFEDIDECCFEHDDNKLFWNPKETRRGLTNPLSYTLSTCGHDNQFLTCLDNVKKHVQAAKWVRRGFLKFVPKCAYSGYELECIEWNFNFFGRCVSYRENHRSGNIHWQLIDNAPVIPI